MSDALLVGMVKVRMLVDTVPGVKTKGTVWYVSPTRAAALVAAGEAEEVEK